MVSHSFGSGARLVVALCCAFGIGCTRKSAPEDVDASFRFRDAGPPVDAVVPTDGGCVVPWEMRHAKVYAQGIVARGVGKGAPEQRQVIAVLDTAEHRITRWIFPQCTYDAYGTPSPDGYVDMAVASDGRLVLAGTALHWFDPETEACTTLRAPVFQESPIVIERTIETPNNLTFVPRGVLDPRKEMMAAFGYRYLDPDDRRMLFESGFMKYDPATGIPELVFEWNERLGINVSGDLVVAIDPCTEDPRMFVTMAGPRATTRCHACREGETAGVDCGDCLYEVDIRHGEPIRFMTQLPVSHVYGLAMWGEAIYGFSEGDYYGHANGKIVRIAPGGASAAIEEIPIELPEGWEQVHFLGAGSSPSAPILF